MSKKELLLELASFLDSNHAKSIGGATREEVKSIARFVFELTREHLGKQPAELDGEDVRALLTTLLPSRISKGDALQQHVPATLEALLNYLEEEHVAVHAFERRQALVTFEEEFHAAVNQRTSKTRAASETKPFIHGASKLGRNDPCSCGSGKKFKKCHGKPK